MGRFLNRDRVMRDDVAELTVDRNEAFDVGMDTRTRVDDKDYQVPFRFMGTITKLTIQLGKEQRAGEERKTRGQYHRPGELLGGPASVDGFYGKEQT